MFKMKTCRDRLPSDDKHNHRSMPMTGGAFSGSSMFTMKHYLWTLWQYRFVLFQWRIHAFPDVDGGAYYLTNFLQKTTWNETMLFAETFNTTRNKIHWKQPKFQIGMRQTLLHKSQTIKIAKMWYQLLWLQIRAKTAAFHVFIWFTFVNVHRMLFIFVWCKLWLSCHIFVAFRVGKCDNKVSTSFVARFSLPLGTKNVTTSENIEVTDAYRSFEYTLFE